jgi:hypothetical protein
VYADKANNQVIIIIYQLLIAVFTLFLTDNNWQLVNDKSILPKGVKRNEVLQVLQERWKKHFQVSVHPYWNGSSVSLCIIHPLR